MSWKPAEPLPVRQEGYRKEHVSIYGEQDWVDVLLPDGTYVTVYGDGRIRTQSVARVEWETQVPPS